jgi:hypothetical protein
MGSRCHRPGYPPDPNSGLRRWLWTTAAELTGLSYGLESIFARSSSALSAMPITEVD